jgi:hypothetical protein
VVTRRRPVTASKTFFRASSIKLRFVEVFELVVEPCPLTEVTPGVNAKIGCWMKINRIAKQLQKNTMRGSILCIVG